MHCRARGYREAERRGKQGELVCVSWNFIDIGVNQKGQWLMDGKKPSRVLEGMKERLDRMRDRLGQERRGIQQSPPPPQEGLFYSHHLFHLDLDSLYKKP